MNDLHASRKHRTLDLLNFAATDVRDGWGPYLSLILIEKHFSTGQIGNILSFTSLVTILVSMPAGWAYRNGRFACGIFIAACASIAVSSLLTSAASDYLTIAILQGISGAACAFVMPGITAFSAQLAKGAGLAKRLGRNEAFNHGGNLGAGVLNAKLVTWLGPRSVSAVILAGAVITSFAAWFGFRKDELPAAVRQAEEHSSPLAHDRRDIGSSHRLPTFFLLGFAFFFQVLNAALLVMKVQQISLQDPAAGAVFLAWGIVVAQLVSVPVAWWLGHALKRGFRLRWWVIGSACVMGRAYLFLHSASLTVYFGAQVLDGIAGGFIAVAPISLLSLLNRRKGELPLGAGGMGFTMALASTFSFFGASRIAVAKGFDAYFQMATVSGLTLLLFVVAIRLAVPKWAAARG